MKEWNRFLDVEGVFIFKKLIGETIYTLKYILATPW